MLVFCFAVVWSWCSQYFWFIFFSISHNRWAFSEFLRVINVVIYTRSNSIVVFIITFVMFICVKRCAIEWQVLFWTCLLGSFSRSAVNHESGAKTGLSGIITAIIMGCALLFLTSLFEYIPQVGFLGGAFVFDLNCLNKELLDGLLFFYHVHSSCIAWLRSRRENRTYEKGKEEKLGRKFCLFLIHQVPLTKRTQALFKVA